MTEQPQKRKFNLVIMFADISGSTSLYERLGDAKARTAIAACLRAVVDIVRKHKGKIIKTIGDELMCAIPETDRAVGAACEIHEHLDQNSFEGVNLSMRIGLHHGPVIIEKKDSGKDVFGDAVNIAARMVAQAKPHQTILTEDTMKLLSNRFRNSGRFVDTAPIKGKKESIKIYEILWMDEDATSMATPFTSAAQEPLVSASMYLRYRNDSRKLDRTHTSLSIGRGEDCGLAVRESLASRHHMRIELRRDKFFIIDQSTNGTHVRFNGGGDTFLRREEMPLTGQGVISLGRAFDDNPTELVAFSLDKPVTA